MHGMQPGMQQAGGKAGKDGKMKDKGKKDKDKAKDKAKDKDKKNKAGKGGQPGMAQPGTSAPVGCRLSRPLISLSLSLWFVSYSQACMDNSPEWGSLE